MAVFNPGNEPENLKKKLNDFFAKLDEFYPDKVVVALHNTHKKLGEKLTALYRELGYENGNSLLEAYGYTIEAAPKKPRAKKTEEQKENECEELLRTLKNRITPQTQYYTLSDLQEGNPDLAKRIRSAKFTQTELLEAGIISKKASKAVSEAERYCSDLEKHITKNCPEQKFYSVGEIIEDVPCSPYIIEQLLTIQESRPEELENLGVSGFLKLQGIISDYEESNKENPRLRKRMELEKAVILKTDTSKFSLLTEAQYGQTASQFLNSRIECRPEGKIGRALKLLEKSLPIVEQCTVNGIISANDIEETTVKKLQRAASDLGYDNVETLLNAYGYSLSPSESQFTRLIRPTNDVPDMESANMDNLSSYAQVRMPLLKACEVVREKFDFRKKQVIITGNHEAANYMDRLDCIEKYIKRKGGTVAKAPTLKTDCVILLPTEKETSKMNGILKKVEVNNLHIQLILFEDIAKLAGIKLDKNEKSEFEQFVSDFPEFDKMNDDSNEVEEVEFLES